MPFQLFSFHFCASKLQLTLKLKAFKGGNLTFSSYLKYLSKYDALCIECLYKIKQAQNGNIKNLFFPN